MANITSKLNKNTGENIQGVTVTQWAPTGATPVTLNSGNEATYLGGLYNKDTQQYLIDGVTPNPTYLSYFKWKTPNSYPVSRLTTINQSNFIKLIADFGTEPAIINIDKTVPITSSISIPSNIKLEWNPDVGLNISTNVVVTINSEINALDFQIFFGLGNVKHINSSVNVAWWGTVGNGVAIDSLIFNKAKFSFLTAGGQIKFPPGEYMSDINGWQVLRDNITITGSGKGITTLKTPTNSTSAGIQVALYRTGGWVSTNDTTGYVGTLGTAFTPPMFNETVVVTITAAPINNTQVIINGNYYQVVGVSGTTITLKNINQGNNFTPVTLPASVTTVNSLLTFEDTALAGNGYIDVKTGQDIAFLREGTKIFINAGASAYDQHYGEPNVITSVVGNRVYLLKNLSRDYTLDTSSYGGNLLSDFTPPAYGATAVASISPAIGNNNLISIENNLYLVTAVAGTNATLRSMNVTNTTALMPTGSRVYGKGRTIFLIPSSVRNTVVENLSVIGYRGGVIVSNTMDTLFRNVDVTRITGSVNGGVWIDGDNGRDFNASYCTFTSPEIIGSQFARSFNGAHFFNCTMNQCALAFSEFNINCSLMYSHINIYNKGALDTSIIAFAVGQTTSNIRVEGNTFNANNIGAVISGVDIQTYTATGRFSIKVNDNIITAQNCTSIFDFVGAGNVNIEGNDCRGKVERLFAGTAAISYSTTGYMFDVANRAISGNKCRIHNNTFSGYVDAIFTRTDLTNLEFTSNEIDCYGDYTPGGGATIIAKGNILPSNNVTVDIEGYIIKDNTFKNWYYTKDSINFPQKKDIRVNISNNKFFNTRGNYRTDKDFVIGFADRDYQLYAPLSYLGSIPTLESDMQVYQDNVAFFGGVLSATDIANARALLTSIYGNSLRNDITSLYPMLGDATASRVAIIGWDKNLYKAFTKTTLVDADFNTAIGWTGDGTSKYGGITKATMVDLSNNGLFVQMTAPSSGTGDKSIIGYTTGSTSYNILNINGAIIKGLGSQTIIADYNLTDVGFMLSAQNKSLTQQLNYVDFTAKPNASNTNYTAVQALATTVIADFCLFAGQPNARLSNASVGCFGQVKLLTLDKAKTLRTIIRNLMVLLSRPVQASDGWIINTSTDSLGNPINLAINATTVPYTKAQLNALYPYAKLNYMVIQDGANMAYIKKDDSSSGNWSTFPSVQLT